MCVRGYIALFDGSVGLTLLLSGEREVLNYFLLYNNLSLPYDLAFWKGFLHFPKLRDSGKDSSILRVYFFFFLI